MGGLSDRIERIHGSVQVIQPAYTKVLVTGPAAEPISRTEAKLHGRIDHADEDTYVDGLIAMAREAIEARTGLTLVTQTWKLLYDRWPEHHRYLILGRGPVTNVDHVKYTDTDGTERTWASSNYHLDGLANPPRLHLAWDAFWPSETLRPGKAIEVQIDCGFGNAGAVPNRIKQAMLLLIEAMYRNRGEVVLGNNASADSKRLAFGVENLLADLIQEVA